MRAGAFLSTKDHCIACGRREWAAAHPVYMPSIEDRVIRYDVLRCNNCDARFISGSTALPISDLRRVEP